MVLEFFVGAGGGRSSVEQQFSNLFLFIVIIIVQDGFGLGAGG